MRIAVDARSMLARHRRGEGKCLFSLYEAMGRLHPDWEFLFYGEYGGTIDGLGRIPNGRARVFDMRGHRFNLWENLGLPVRVQWDRVDLLHSTSSSAPLWCGAPVVMTVHDIIPVVSGQGLAEDEIRRFDRGLRNGLRYAKKIIAVSGSTRDDLVRVYGVPVDRLEVIHWGSELPATHSASPLAAAQAGASQTEAGAPYVFAFGGADPRKNTAAVIRAFAEAAHAAADVRLVIVGLPPGEARQCLQELVCECGVEARVDLLDYVPEAQLQALLSGALCLLYPSRYEGFGMPLLEAMGAGVPTITSNVSSMPEVAGEAALLVDPDNVDDIAAALRTLVTDEALRAELAAKGRARAATFTWERAAAATAAVFEQVAAA